LTRRDADEPGGAAQRSKKRGSPTNRHRLHRRRPKPAASGRITRQPGGFRALAYAAEREAARGIIDRMSVTLTAAAPARRPELDHLAHKVRMLVAPNAAA